MNNEPYNLLVKHLLSNLLDQYTWTKSHLNEEQHQPYTQLIPSGTHQLQPVLMLLNRN